MARSIDDMTVSLPKRLSPSFGEALKPAPGVRALVKTLENLKMPPGLDQADDFLDRALASGQARLVYL